MKNQTNQQIKNRMIRKAATLWGVPANEIESSFDPVVSLLIGACASEIEKISGELNDSRTRITERLIQLMTPDTIYGARPAHAIATAHPVENTTKITPEHLLYFKKKTDTNKASRKLKNIYFSPVQDHTLVNASIKQMIVGDKLIEFNYKLKNFTELQIKDPRKIPRSTIFLGIETRSKEVPLKDVSIYFELLDIAHSELFYHHLKNAAFYFEGKKIDVATGYFNSHKTERLNLEAIFDFKANKTKNIEDEVKESYKKHYITLTKKLSIKKEKQLPEELEAFIDAKDLDELKDLHWIKVVFPRIIDESILEHIFCTFNAFPVLNRKWESFSYQLKEFIDIVPISTPELFLDIKSITNTSGRRYKLREKDASEHHKGTYLIRQDNVGKLDARKAKEHLNHFIELLKDESASFSFIGNDFLQSNINELNQTISLLEKKVSDSKSTSLDITYIAVEPLKKRDTLLIDYWVTNGMLANGIKSGSTLQVYQGSDLNQKGSMLLSTSLQGKDNLSMEERLNAYRRALLSRKRIVTKEDVKALCYELCGDKVSQVTVRKGFNKDISVNKGIVPCIEVILYSNKKVNNLDVGWEALKSNILSALSSQSLNVFPYKITVVHS